MSNFNMLMQTKQKILSDMHHQLWEQYTEYFKSLMSDLPNTSNIFKIKIKFHQDIDNKVCRASTEYEDKYGNPSKIDDDNLIDLNIEKELYTIIQDFIEDFPKLHHVDTLEISNTKIHGKFHRYSNINYELPDNTPRIS